MIKPTKRQQEMLDLLQEECAELIQIISKIRRFGFDSSHNGKTNMQALSEELTDVNILMDYAKDYFGMETFNEEYAVLKLIKLRKYTDLFDADDVNDKDQNIFE